MPFADDITVGRVPATSIRRGYAVLSAIDSSLSVGAKQMGLAIAVAESNLGLFPPLVGPRGEPSNNWGAVVYTGASQAPPFGDNPGFVIAHDHDAAGNPTLMRFAAFPTMEAGARNFLGTWLRHADTRSAANSGDAHATAAAMFGHHYYDATCAACGISCEGMSREEALAACGPGPRINAYTKFIMGRAPQVAKALGQPLAVGRGPVAQPGEPREASTSTGARLVGSAIVGYAALQIYRHFRRP